MLEDSGNSRSAKIGSIIALTRFSLSRSAKLSKCVSCRLMRISFASKICSVVIY
jgi:hypothetical protein